MIPRAIQPHHVVEALARIDQAGVPPARRSVHYDLVVDGRTYPPKYAISIACDLATGRELSPDSFTAHDANGWLKARDFDVLDRRQQGTPAVRSGLTVRASDNSKSILRERHAANWSREEVEAVVTDYFDMLMHELVGQQYSKAVHRRALLGLLGNRSESSVERKHQNISAALIDLGCPYVAGYQPLSNYQGLLFEVVADRVMHDQPLNRSMKRAIEQPIADARPDFDDVEVPVPAASIAGEPTAPAYHRRVRGVHRDYLAQEASHSELGAAGERFVLAYEHFRLTALGKSRLAERVEHAARTKGDGLGYDVLSYEPDGRERFIEVKTTAYGKDTPFFVTPNEVEFSRDFASQFHLYRVFEFRRRPRYFDLAGSVQGRCRLDPVSFLARLTTP